MKKIIILIILILATIGCSNREVNTAKLEKRDGIIYEIGQTQPFTGKRVSYYSNGKLTFEISYMDGKLDGINRYYYEKGQIKIDTKFKNGQQEGIAKEYYDNGNLEAVSEYKNGLLNGERKDYYKNGQLRGIANYKDGKAFGHAKTFFEDGTLESETDFTTGFFKVYNDNGSLRQDGKIE